MCITDHSSWGPLVSFCMAILFLSPFFFSLRLFVRMVHFTGHVHGPARICRERGSNVRQPRVEDVTTAGSSTGGRSGRSSSRRSLRDGMGSFCCRLRVGHADAWPVALALYSLLF